MIGAGHIFLQGSNPRLLQFADLIVDGHHIKLFIRVKALFRDGGEQSLDVFDRQDILKIVDKDHDQYMFLRILLLHGRGKQVVLGIIIDHGLGQDLIVIVTLGGVELFLHEGGHLIHVEIYIGNIAGPHILDPRDTGQDAFQHVLRVNCHFITSMQLLYSF